MSWHEQTFRKRAKSGLRTIGLLSVARRIRESVRDYTDRELQHQKRQHRELFLRFKNQYGHLLQHRRNNATDEPKVALICSIHFPEVHLELAFIKALEMAGFVPVVLTLNEKWLLRKYYELAGVSEVHEWRKFADLPDLAAASASVNRYSSAQDLMTLEYEGSRVGRYALCTALRGRRLGSVDLESPHGRDLLVRSVAAGMAYTKAAQKIFERFRPDLVVMTDKGYTPKGQLFDLCLARGTDVVSWDLGHNSNALILQRYNYENRDQQNNSLSPESWRYIQDLDLTEDHRNRLAQELYGSYANNDWYSTAGTQFYKRFVDAGEIRERIGLDPRKKTAFIFPHISWDASLFWGESLFYDYEEWFIETVRAACKNDRVNWVIKIHPAHVGKALREGFQDEPSEVVSLRKNIGELPPHVFVIPADTDISTFSVFEIMDYCLTVRGTVGIEAARLGIPALTAGMGCYAKRGFTIDSDSREQYFDRLANIQSLTRLSPQQVELAEHFAFGHFLLRPLPLSTVTLKYHQSLARHLAEGRINIGSKEDWHRASDLKALSEWLAHSKQPDFLKSLEDWQLEMENATAQDESGSSLSAQLKESSR